MGQQTTDQIAFLIEARTALEELGVVKDREKQLKIDEIKVGKTLEVEKRTVEETINTTVRKRREAISSSYEAEMDKAEGNRCRTMERRCVLL